MEEGSFALFYLKEAIVRTCDFADHLWGLETKM
jgi:hypothetical protein